ncbi:MAG: hypothetical protein K0R57_2128 [Paenibacillaceae bacterium]|jgi:hypothetical protein|nr:hypothetical protein [Paenibacillaceae bacterium]
MNQDDMYREDPLRVGRGIALGVVIGALMWAGIIAGVVMVLR